MDACGLRFRRPGPPISCPGRPICGQSQICAEAHVLGDTRTPVASGLSAGRPFPAFTPVAALPSRGQGLDYFCERSTGDLVALHRTLNAATWCALQSYGAEVIFVGPKLKYPPSSMGQVLKMAMSTGSRKRR